MDAAVDAVILIDHIGCITGVNHSAERLFGYTAAEIHGQRVSVLLQDPRSGAHDAHLARYAATGIPHVIGVGTEVQATCKDGSTFPAHLSVGRVTGEGSPWFVGFIRDMTAERQALATLQAERDLARAHLALDHAMLLTLDAEHRIRSINASGCNLLGSTESALHGQDWIEIAFAPAERATARAELQHAATLPPDQPYTCEYTIRTAGGESRLVSWRSISLHGAGGAPAGILCSVEDITARRRAEDERRRSAERLVHVARLATMGEMAAGIAHELNQPLTAITNYARACERFIALPAPDLDETRDAMREIAGEALRAGDMIRRLRQFVRNSDSERLPTDINTIVDELRVLTQADARMYDTHISFDRADGLPMVCVDRVQITQVLLNLLRNALEALSSEPRGARRIVLSTRRARDGDVEVSVEDNGRGVDPGILDRLFDPFLTTKSQGTGLGLSMCRTIVSAHGGTVTYAPAAPHGASFRLTLPAWSKA
jgi:two-component system sensor kinase FixL